MNERILSPQLLELVQAAGPGYSQADPEWIKKFAELIVQECTSVLLRWKAEPFPFDEDLAVSLIREHFGASQ